MANEISASMSFSAAKAGGVISGVYSNTYDMSGTHMLSNVQSVGTSSETLFLGDIASLGSVMVKNLDPTNYVQIDSGTAFDKFPQKILPGQMIFLNPQTITIYAKANTAPCDIQVTAAEL